LLAAALFTILLVAGCAAPAMPGAPSAEAAPATLVVATHDSFAASEEVIAAFEQANNATVQFLALGDAGAALNKLILSKDAPLADVFFGVDNTFLSRALNADLFAPYASPLLAEQDDALQLDPNHRLLPVDRGFVTLNADRAWFAQRDLALPTSLADLADPAYADLLVVQNPATSSPGLAFLLATIAHLGEENWQGYWADLQANGVLVVDGWSQAYYEHFTVGSGGTGDRPLVVSYSSSPPADMIFATDGRTEPGSVNVNLEGGVFQQIEFVGILKGTEQQVLAERWVDFMLDTQFQNDIPLQMFVYPVNRNAELPPAFVEFAPQPTNAVEMDPATIEANREAWLQRWSEIMLR
jgi:thiamine transport system substrate-binding protein